MKLKTILVATGLSVLFSMQALAGWNQTNNGQWTYDQNGTRLTGQWLDDNGTWYYLGTDGIMLANTTQNINGVDYTFDASGKWLDPNAPRTGVSDGVYTNVELNYSMQLPDGIPYTVDENGSLYMESGTAIIAVTTFTNLPSYASSTELVDLFTEKLVSGIGYLVSMEYQTTAQIGDFNCQKTHFTANEYAINGDLYTSIQDNGFFCIFVAYNTDTKPAIDNALNSLRRLP